MRRTIAGIAIGASLALGLSWAYDVYQGLETAKRSAQLQTANPEDWVDMQSFVVDGVPPGKVPMAHITFQILKPVAVRTTISPRNLTTGQSVCEGRVSALYDEPRPVRSFSTPVSALAGLQSCDFPPGEYTMSVTIIPTDLATNVQLKPIIFEHHFSVAAP